MKFIELLAESETLGLTEGFNDNSLYKFKQIFKSKEMSDLWNKDMLENNAKSIKNAKAIKLEIETWLTNNSTLSYKTEYYSIERVAKGLKDIHLAAGGSNYMARQWVNKIQSYINKMLDLMKDSKYTNSLAFIPKNMNNPAMLKSIDYYLRDGGVTYLDIKNVFKVTKELHKKYKSNNKDREASGTNLKVAHGSLSQNIGNGAHSLNQEFSKAIGGRSGAASMLASRIMGHLEGK